MSAFEASLPGRALEELLIASEGTAEQLAETCGVPLDEVYAVLDGRAAVTQETAERFAKQFRTAPSYWLDLQARADECARDGHAR